jgi:hypothetical protein
MFQVNPGRVCRWAVVVCVAVAAMLADSAQAQMIQPKSLKDIVASADQIVVGQCVERKMGVQNGRIVTQYKVKPDEFWKGERSLDSDGAFLMSEYGGSLSNFSKVPIAQFVPGSSNMAPGEDVLLFLANPSSAAVQRAARKSAVRKAAAPKGRSRITQSVETSPKVVGAWQGRFDVITNPEDGSRTIAQPGISAVPGATVNAELRQSLLRSRGLKVTRTADGAEAVVRDDNVRLTADKKKQLTERLQSAARQSRKEHEEKVKQTPKAAEELYPMQSLDAAKATILKLVKETKK